VSETDEQPGPVGNSWGTRPTEQQQAELEKVLREWDKESDHGERVGPFEGEHLSGADVFWLMVLVCSGPNRTVVEVEQVFLQSSLQSPESHTWVRTLLSALPTLHLERTILTGAHLERTDLRNAHLEGAILAGAHLDGADLRNAHLDGAHLERARLAGAHLEGARLDGAFLMDAHLDGAHLERARLAGADLREARLDGAHLIGAHLKGANFILTSFDKTSRLNEAYLNHVILDQVIFDNTNLTGVAWRDVRTLGDELRANSQDEYRAAARAYRALSVALRNQGITDAARFHYQSEVMERKALFQETKGYLFSRSFYRAPLPFARWLVSWVLGKFMGYGDYIWRLFLTYVGVVFTFAAIYLGIAYQPPKKHPLTAIPWPHALAAISWVRDLLSFWFVRFPAAIHMSTPSHLLDMLVFSVTAFHGRGLQQLQNPSEVVIWWAGLEAVLGLLIEALFVAAFARRVTGG